MTLNPWTGWSELLPETFKFGLRPVWWGAGTERHSPPPSLLAKQLLKGFARFPISCISLLWIIHISRSKQCCISYCHLCKLNCCEVALQELLMAMSRWICLFFNSISKFLNLSFYQNCRKIIVLRFWKGKTSNTTIATCNCNSRNLPLGPLCLRQCFLNPSLSSVEWSTSTTQLQKLSHCSAQSDLQTCGALHLCSSCQALWWW